jgi:hypothetical protein
MKTETMFKAYIEAVYFTDTGDNEQPDSCAELTDYFKARAYIDCRNFLYATKDLSEDDNPEQLGHDLWLTRNGHGTGFWDRPEVYGTANATLYARIATAMGEHDSEFLPDNSTYGKLERTKTHRHSHR